MSRTILERLRVHQRVVTAAILLVAITGITGMQWVRHELGLLTERSTPFQVRTLDLQRAIQHLATNLAKLSTSSGSDVESVSNEVRQSLDEIHSAQDSLQALSIDGSVNAWQELSSPSMDLAKSAHARDGAERTAQTSDSLIELQIQSMTGYLHQLDEGIRILQKATQTSFETSQAKLGATSIRQREANEARSLIKDIQIAAQQILSASTRKEILMGKARYNAAISQLQQSSWGKESEAALNATAASFDDLLRLRQAIVAASTSELQEKANIAWKSLEEHLNGLQLNVGQESTLATERLGVESSRQKTAFQQTIVSNNTLAANSELVTIGYAIETGANHLFASQTQEEVETIAASMKALFEKAGRIRTTMEKDLSVLRSNQENNLLQQSWSRISKVEALLFATGSAIDRVKDRIRQQREVQRLSGQIREVVDRQAKSARSTLESARGDQAHAVVRVNRTIWAGLFLIAGISFAAVIFGSWYGGKLYKSIQLPLVRLIEAANRVSDGVLASVAPSPTQDEIGQVLQSVGKMVSSLRAMVEKIGTETHHLATQSVQLAQTANGLGESTNSQNQLVYAFQDSMAQMSRSIEIVIDGTREASAHTAQMQDVTRAGVRSTQAMVERMNEFGKLLERVESRISSLSTASQDVGQVVVAIQTIAGQAHLLSFNATIEAARAGQSGRGFAVVAEEFRKLSQQSREASSTAAKTIQEIQSGIRETCDEVIAESQAIRAISEEIIQIRSGMDQIGIQVEATTRSIQAISQSAESQGAARETVVEGTVEISKGAECLDRMASEIHKTASELSQIAGRLDSLMRWFKLL